MTWWTSREMTRSSDRRVDRWRAGGRSILVYYPTKILQSAFNGTFELIFNFWGNQFMDTNSRVLESFGVRLEVGLGIAQDLIENFVGKALQIC